MNTFRFIRRLVTAQMWLHPGRALITIVGVIASTCAVVWVVSGYDALVSQFDENAQKYLGHYDVLVLPMSPPGQNAFVTTKIVEDLKADPGVLEVNSIQQSRVSVTRVQQADDAPDESPLGLLIGSRPPVNGAPPIDPILVATPATEAPYEMVNGSWLEDDFENGVVISEGAAEQIRVSVGDELLVTSLANQVRLQVVGIVEQAPDPPSFGGRGGRGGRGRNSASEGRPGPNGKKGESVGRERSPEDSGREEKRPRPQRPDSENADEDTNEGKTDETQLGMPSAYVQGPATRAVYVRPSVAEKINGFSAEANVLQIAFRDGVTAADFQTVWKERFDAGRPALRIVSYYDVRTGMESTRAVSGQRSQAWAATGMATMAAIFIIFSTLSMGVSERMREFAMLRAIGLTRLQLASMIALESLTLAVLGWIGGLAAGWLLLQFGSQLLPGLFGNNAILGGMSILLTGLTVIVGALGAAILPAWRAMRIKPLDAMSTQAPVPKLGRWLLLSAVGLVLASTAPLSVFMIPMVDDWRVWTYSFVTWPALFVGMIFLTPVAVLLCERLFGPLVTACLRLDSRLVKTQLSSDMWRTIGATLALSLGLALFASTQTWGFSMLQPFLPGDWLPDMLVAFHPVGLDEDGIEEIRAVNGVRKDSVMPLAIEQTKFDWGDEEPPERMKYDNAVIFGLDPEFSFAGNDPFLNVTFIEGNRDETIKSLESGTACVISQDFQMSTGLKVGDELTFIPPSAPDERVSYKIAAVVALPGWHWVTKFSGVRRHFVRTSTVIFANHDHVHDQFHLNRAEFFWMNLDDDAALPSIEADFQKIAEQDAGKTFQAEGFGQVKAYRPFARATATQTVRKAISIRANDMIWGMSKLPLVTLAIMSLAVANAVLASVRSRTWEFGVLRSVGLTRWQLVRLILAETVLIGMSACLLSLGFGLAAGWCGVGMAQFGGWFAGPPTFLVPWRQLGIGFLLTVILCLLAGLWPAVKAGRAEPLKLLQAGRSAV